jgi:hypothetical protein
MSKKLLSEAEMRRFMGLAGIRPPAIKTRIQETYGGPMTERSAAKKVKKEEYVMPEEKHDDPMEMMGEPAMEDMEDKPEMKMDEPDMMDQPEDMPAPADDALEGLSDEMKEELFSAVASAAAEVLDLDVEMEMGDDKDDEPEMDDAPEMPDAMDDMKDDEPAPLEEEENNNLEEEENNNLEEENISVQLSEEDIVNEVARRVAKRLVKASKANKTLKEALGRK